MEPVTLTRQKLYELVWSTPMKKLAAQFGLSDVGLAKTCDRFDIPRPGRGYWAQLAAGQKPARPKLPKGTGGVDQAIALHRLIDPVSPEAAPRVVAVKERTAERHPAVSWLETAFKKCELDGYGRSIVGYSWHPSICVRPVSVPRTLSLLDALFTTLTERGHSVEAKPRGTEGQPELIVDTPTDKGLWLEVEEKLATRPHVLTPEERNRNERWGAKIRKHDYFADGHLAIRIQGAHYKYQGRKAWSDTQRQRLDDLLGQVILTIEAIADFNHREHLALQEEQRAAELRERQRLRGERLEAWREWLGRDLERLATEWRRATEVSAFLDAFEHAVSTEARSPTTDAWLAAARRFVERMDPLRVPDQVPKKLDPSDEELAAFVDSQRRQSGGK